MRSFENVSKFHTNFIFTHTQRLWQWLVNRTRWQWTPQFAITVTNMTTTFPGPTTKLTILHHTPMRVYNTSWKNVFLEIEHDGLSRLKKILKHTSSVNSLKLTNLKPLLPELSQDNQVQQPNLKLHQQRRSIPHQICVIVAVPFSLILR